MRLRLLMAVALKALLPFSAYFLMGAFLVDQVAEALWYDYQGYAWHWVWLPYDYLFLAAGGAVLMAQGFLWVQKVRRADP